MDLVCCHVVGYSAHSVRHLVGSLTIQVWTFCWILEHIWHQYWCQKLVAFTRGLIAKTGPTTERTRHQILGGVMYLKIYLVSYIIIILHQPYLRVLWQCRRIEQRLKMLRSNFFVKYSIYYHVFFLWYSIRITKIFLPNDPAVFLFLESYVLLNSCQSNKNHRINSW